MKPTTLPCLCLCLCLLAAAIPARAAEPAPAAPEQQTPTRRPDWTIGTGVQWRASSASYASALPLSYSIGGLSGLSSLYLEPRAAPDFLFLVERRAGARTWLSWVVGAGHARSTESAPGSLPSDALAGTTRRIWSETGTTTAGTSLGGRFVLNPGGAVEVSALGGVGLDFVTMSGASRTLKKEENSVGETRTEGTASSLALGLTVGLAFERALTDALALRATLGLAALTWRRGTSESQVDDETPVRANTTALEGGLRVTPGLELRMYL